MFDPDDPEVLEFAKAVKAEFERVDGDVDTFDYDRFLDPNAWPTIPLDERERLLIDRVSICHELGGLGDDEGFIKTMNFLDVMARQRRCPPAN